MDSSGAGASFEFDHQRTAVAKHHSQFILEYVDHALYIFIDVVDTNLNPYYTGVFLTIPKPAASSRTLVETEFEYFVQKGDSVAVWVQGDAQLLGSVTPFAILGFKVLPTGTPLSSVGLDTFFTSPPHPKVEPSIYNRFPFNNIMNTIAQRPISFENQLNILHSGNTSGIYGRSLTQSDYNARLSAMENRASLYRDGSVYLFSQQKTEGTFLDVSSLFQNTRTLETQYHWKGVHVNAGAILNVETLDQHNMPSIVDYLSLDLHDPIATLEMIDNISEIMVDRCQFRFATIRHDLDPDIQFKSVNLFFSHKYIRIFAIWAS